MTDVLKNIDRSALPKRIKGTVREMANDLVIMEEEIKNLKEQAAKEKERRVNKETNQPSGKKPEWEKDNPQGNGGRKNPPGGKRNGSGNRSKQELIPDRNIHNELSHCPDCGKCLKDQQPIGTNERVIEDIEQPPDKTVVTKETDDRKWCTNCQKIVSAKSELALDGADIGFNAMILMAYLWVVTAVSLPNIQRFVMSFLHFAISTSGISKIMIRIAEILKPVAEEIRGEVKHGNRLWADETGWRVKGVTWWLWAFANETAAYYFAVPCRGSPVIQQIIGNFFMGVLITDGWAAYNLLICLDRQTCMSHIYRKIRHHIYDNPNSRSLLKFYTRLRRILKDGQRLSDLRGKISEEDFWRRYERLCQRLEDLLSWQNPNKILKKIIASIRRQQDRILTFVKIPGLPNHNNYGEYIIRKGVLKRKVSGGSMSKKGAEAYAILISIAQTCHLRKLSFCQFLRASLLHYNQTGRPMLLSEYETHINKRKKAA